MAQFGRALRSGRRSRKFESCHLDQKITREELHSSRVIFRLIRMMMNFSDEVGFICAKITSMKIFIERKCEVQNLVTHFEELHSSRVIFRLIRMMMNFSDEVGFICAKITSMKIFIERKCEVQNLVTHLEECNSSRVIFRLILTMMNFSDKVGF